MVSNSREKLIMETLRVVMDTRGEHDQDAVVQVAELVSDEARPDVHVVVSAYVIQPDGAQVHVPLTFDQTARVRDALDTVLRRHGR